MAVNLAIMLMSTAKSVKMNLILGWKKVKRKFCRCKKKEAVPVVFDTFLGIDEKELELPDAKDDGDVIFKAKMKEQADKYMKEV
jgi:hypothetical protein